MNKSGITTQTASTPGTILFASEPKLAVSAKLANTGLTADSNGKKIVKAGTPIAGSLDARGTAFTVATTTKVKIAAANSAGTSAEVKEVDSSSAIGVLMHDADVTDGTQNVAVLLFGYVDKAKVTTTVATAIAAHKNAGGLPQITLMA